MKPEELWLNPVPRGERILMVGPWETPGIFRETSSRARQWSERAGLDWEMISTSSRDPRLLTLPRETYRSIYWDATPGNAPPFPLEQIQRVLLTFFQSLRPRDGILAMSFASDSWSDEALGSLCRQSGFQKISTFVSEAEGQSLWILCRI